MQLCLAITWSHLYGQISLLFCYSSAKLQPWCSRCVPSLQLFFQLLHNNILWAMFFFQICMRSEPQLMPPRTTHSLWMQMRSRDWKSPMVENGEKTFPCAGGQLKNCGQWWRELRVPRMRQSSASVGAVCRKTAVKPRFSKQLFICLWNAPKTWPVTAYSTWLDRKMLNLERRKGLIWNIQQEYAAYTTCIEWGILSYLDY